MRFSCDRTKLQFNLKANHNTLAVVAFTMSPVTELFTIQFES